MRHLNDVPLIFAGTMWQGLLEWTRQSMLHPGLELAGEQDLQIPRCVPGADEAIALVREHFTRWQVAHKRPA